MRRIRPKKSDGLRSFAAAERAELKAEIRALKAAAAKYVRIREAQLKLKHQHRKERVQTAFKKFKPAKKLRGKIVFIGLNGKAIMGRSNRKGYAVYVNGNGKKALIRSFNRKRGFVDLWPDAKKLSAIDVTRARSKRAKKAFLTTHLTEAARGELTKTTRGLSAKGTRFAGTIKTNKFWRGSDAVAEIAKELATASNKQKSRKDFLVSIGIWVVDGEKQTHFIELQRRFARADGQKTNADECRDFLGLEVYGFLARELTMRGLVLAGSATHIGRLKENRKKPRDEWRKDGFLWEGHDSENVKIEKVEYRIDQQSFGK